MEDLRSFREEYFKSFKMPRLLKESDGLYFNGQQVQTHDGKPVTRGAGFLNVFYKGGGSSSELSNLYPHQFEFRGKIVGSAEGIFQGIKFCDVASQNEVLKLSGLPAVKAKDSLCAPWQETGLLYWQGQQINRYGQQYADFVDGVFEGLIKNPFFVKAVKQVPERTYILHSIGKDLPSETVLTRLEFERQLNMLHDYFQQ